MKQLMILAVLPLALLSCAKSSDETKTSAPEAQVASKGSCPLRLIEASNKLNDTVKLYRSNHDPQTRADIAAQCGELQKMFDTAGPCTAFVKETGQNQTITIGIAAPACDQVN